MSLRTAPSGVHRRLTAFLATAVVTVLSVSVLGPLPPASAAAPTLTYVAAASAARTSTTHLVTIPATVAAGDTLVLFMTSNTRSGTLTGPAGWTQLQAREGSASRGRAWTRKATLADRGSVVTARTSVTAKSTLSVAAYRSSAGTSAVTAWASATVATGATSHRTPATTASQPGSHLISYWAGKTSTTTPPTWTPPTNVTRRTGANAAGANLVSGILADSNAPLAVGAIGARLARTSKSLTSSQLMSVVVSPGLEPANRAPVAAFTSSCDSLACSFDGSGSSDADGDPLSYGWTFGDGGTATGAKPAHTYARTGERDVILTVSDGKTTTSLSKPVEATYAEPLPGHTGLVPEAPRTDLPKISNGEINDIEVVGSRVYVAGTFTSIANQRTGNTTSYPQRYLAAYDLNTGLVEADFNPTFAGPADFTVSAVEASPDGTRVYVAGGFNTVNGATKKGLVLLDPDTGDTVDAFTADADARVTEVAVSGSTVYLGGRFGEVNDLPRKSLAAVDALTGAVDPGFVNNLSGGIGVNGGLAVQKLLLTHDGGKLVVVHTGRQINGQDRYGIGIVDTATKQLLPWRTRLWDENLQFVGGVQRIITGSIAPNDEWFVVSSGSGGDRPPINDTVVAYSLDGDGAISDVKPRWISRAFDSVYGTVISEKAVYIGGHFAWNESPSAPTPWPGAADIGYGTGQGLSGYGLGDSVVAREHLGALNPTDGTALEWNPGSNSEIGNTSMALTPRGLITGGDATTQGGYNVGRVAFFDFDDVAAPNGVETSITTPISGRVLPTAHDFTIEGTASAPGGVDKVTIELQERDGLKRWLNDSDGTLKLGAGDRVPATLANRGAETTTWSLTVPGNLIPANVKMHAYARAWVDNDLYDPTKAYKKFEAFGLADAPPTLSYTTPVAGVVNTKTLLITGSVADDLGVTGASMTLRDSAGRYLQDDGTADSTYNTIGIVPDVPNATSSTWSKEVTVPTEGEWRAQARARDTGGNSSLDTTDRTWNVTENGQAPSVSISTPGSVVPPTAPQLVTVEPGERMTFSGTATDDGSIKNVYVALLNNSTGENLTTDGTWGIDNGLNLYKLPGTPDPTEHTYNWSWTTPQNLTPGNYTFAAVALDNENITTPQTAWAIMTMNAVVTGDAPPDAELTTKGVQLPSENLTLNLTGTATDAQGVAEVRLVLKDLDTSRYYHQDGSVSSSYTSIPATVDTVNGTSTTWSRTVELPNEGNWNVTAYAVDTAGQRDLATTGATARYPIYPGDVAPTLTDALLAPTENASFTEGKIFVSGRAEDTNAPGKTSAIAKVEVAIIDAAGKFLSSSGTFGSESWRAAFLTSPGTAGSNFAYTTPVLPAGNYTIKVRAIDQHGLVTATPSERHVTVSIPPGNVAPTAVLPAPVCTENVCQFDAKSSTDENAATLTYSWNFGTGQGTATGPNPKKTFTATGDFVVTLVAKDEWGATHQAQRTVTIAKPAGNTAPVPVINPPSCNAATKTCNFSAVGTTDNLGDSITYAWNFGDTANNTAAGAATAHVFTGAGTYTVTLTATDGWGESAQETLDVTIAP
jgi:large repetitive protein